MKKLTFISLLPLFLSMSPVFGTSLENKSTEDSSQKHGAYLEERAKSRFSSEYYAKSSLQKQQDINQLTKFVLENVNDGEPVKLISNLQLLRGKELEEIKDTFVATDNLIKALSTSRRT